MAGIPEAAKDIRLKNIYLGISESCNAACPFCYREFYSPKPGGFMSDEIFRSILTQIRRIETIESVSLTVAEPTLYPRFDEISIELNKNRRYKTTVVTNMSLAHKHLESLMLYDGIVMSVEGFDRESYENSRRGLKWERVKENIILLDEYIKKHDNKGPRRKINFIVDRSSKIREFVAFWSGYADVTMIDPMLPQTVWKNGGSELKDTSDNLFPFTASKEIVCMEPFYRLGIMSDGSVRPCGTRMYEPKHYGDYRNLPEAFHTNRNILLLRKQREKNGFRGCGNCRHSLEVDRREWEELIREHRDLSHENVVFAKGLMEVNGGIWQGKKTVVGGAAGAIRG